MKTILLAHESPFQIYCANRLFAAGALDGVVIEAGQSMAHDLATLRDVLTAVRTGIQNIRSNPLVGWYRAALQLANVANRSRYYGGRDFHHQRLLVRHDYSSFAEGLHVVRVDRINGPAAIRAVEQARPNIVFVHGTSLIRRPLLERANAPLVNLHWGVSPRYRGEGIVSALALEGPQALGVTVHLLDAGIDSGPILYQAGVSVDPLDNFYSIALKLTVLGTEFFIRVFEDFRSRGRVDAVTRRKEMSQLFSGSYLRAQPELYPRAWGNLRAAVQQTI